MSWCPISSITISARLILLDFYIILKEIYHECHRNRSTGGNHKVQLERHNIHFIVDIKGLFTYHVSCERGEGEGDQKFSTNGVPACQICGKRGPLKSSHKVCI